MSICACCNRVLDPEFALTRNYCPVCASAGCDTFRSRHDEAHMRAFEERCSKKRKQAEYDEQQVNA